MMCLLLILVSRAVVALAAGRRGDRTAPWPGLVALAVLMLTVLLALVAPARLPLMGSLAYTNYGAQLSPYAPPEEREVIERTARSEEHKSELQSRGHLGGRPLL